MLLFALQVYFITSLLLTEWMVRMEVTIRKPDPFRELSYSMVRTLGDGKITTSLPSSHDMLGVGMPNAMQVKEALPVSVASRFSGWMETSGGSIVVGSEVTH